MPKSSPSTVLLRNTNPIGDVELPTLGLKVDANATFEVDADTASVLLEQVGNYELAEG